MSSDPPRHGRRTFPRNYTFDFLMLRAAPRWTACGTHAHASGAVRLRFARRHDDPEVMVAHLHAPAVHPRRPTGDRRRRASRVHVVVQNESGWFDGTQGRALTSPQSTATRIHGQVGDSCLQHDALRFGLFSFCCPRLPYVRPTEAIARPLLHSRSRSRPIKICKERTMLRGARLRGPVKWPRCKSHGNGNARMFRK